MTATTRDSGRGTSDVQAPFDMAAVSRVARRVSLQTLVLVDVGAKRFPFKAENGVLEPEISQHHRVVGMNMESLEVEASFRFSVRREDELVLKATLTYRIRYGIQGEEPIDPKDASYFATANGAYHAWPFVRENLFGLTAKMGLPAFLLPVLAFQQSQTKAAATVGGSSRPRRRRARVAR